MEFTIYYILTNNILSLIILKLSKDQYVQERSIHYA